MENVHMRKHRVRLITLTLLATFMTGAAIDVLAEASWDKNHPRRDQVNDRLANQNKRIYKDMKPGEISKPQAQNLHRQDRQIRREEHAMASQNGGHITKQEQKALNQRQNAVSKKIAQ
jgi:hypothetical protein